MLFNSLLMDQSKMMIKGEAFIGNPVKQILFKDDFQKKVKSDSHTD